MCLLTKTLFKKGVCLKTLKGIFATNSKELA
ncbi:hypothetical protein L932_08270 [Helicobacter pylori PZ5026]|nr:hypothetical protein L932_08270 [Helicobacter pylori PZ5026]